MLTIPESLQAFFKWEMDRGASDRTIQAYALDLAEFTWFVKSRGLADPIRSNEEDLIAWQQELANQELSIATIQRRMSAIRTYHYFLKKGGKKAFDPSEIIPLPEVIEGPLRCLEINEIDALYRAAPSCRDRAIVSTLAGTGCTVGELYSLNEVDVNLDSGVIKLARGRVSRSMLLDLRTRESLQELSPSTQPYPLFRNKNDGRLSERSVRRILISIARRAQIDVERVTPSNFRHTFALSTVRNGTTPAELQKLMGYIRPSFGERYFEGSYPTREQG